MEMSLNCMQLDVCHVTRIARLVVPDGNEIMINDDLLEIGSWINLRIA